MVKRKFIAKVTKDFDYSFANGFRTKKIEGLVTINKTGLPIADAYIIDPDLYVEYKKTKKFPSSFEDELKGAIKELMRKFKSTSLRTCFKFTGFENPRAVPSYRNLTRERDVLSKIIDAYKVGEKIAKDNKITEYQLGLILQGRVNAKSGGIVVADIEKEKICMIEACWGDANLIALGEEWFDTFWINDKLEIVEKTVRNKEIGYFFVGTERKKLHIEEKKKTIPCLSDDEIIKIAEYSLKAAKYHKSNVEIEFMIDNSGRIEMYELQIKPGFTLFKPDSTIIKGDVILKGLVASSGIAEGKVRIVKEEYDLKKISKGDIVVIHTSMMSTFNSLPIMKNAAAIITDSGGLTSHLSTVAKEFGIPCIVGTKRATEILKDGMIVIVNGEEGEIFQKNEYTKELDSDSRVVWLNDSEIKVNSIGNKALNLINMIQLGLPVPEGFIVTTKAFSDFLNENKLAQKINKKLSNINIESLEKLENEMRDDVRKGKFPQHLKEEILKSFKELKKRYPKVAVRSSSNCEDSVKASFAGMFETFLFVDNEDTLLKSIRDCWSSVYRGSVILYALKQGILPRNIRMAVAVQGMIDADKAGVVFTKDIWESNKDAILIEASHGIGENVVGGIKNPDRYVVNKNNSKVIKQEVGDDGILTKNEITELTKFAIILENHFGYPQDIEWAIKDGKVYLLQSRPIVV